MVADSLSRIESVSSPTLFSLSDIAEAQGNDDELRHIIANPECSLSLRKLLWDSGRSAIYCDLSGETVRPYIPSPWRQRSIDLFHDPAHPSARVSDRVIRKHYVWPTMHRDISARCKACHVWQRSKISRHDYPAPAQFVLPDGRFKYIHFEIVNPLPDSDGCRYCLTMIDRFSRSSKAVPLKNVEAITVCRAFYDTWISRYGTPEKLITDQGSHFESHLFTALMQLIGCQKVHTTPYHPAANGMIERWHRSLKAAIMCHNDRAWSRYLSTVMLGLRSNVLDTGSSPAEYLYATTLRIPVEFILPEVFSPEPRMFHEEFREHMRKVKPIPIAQKYKRKTFVTKNLESSTHVFLRYTPCRKSLERPYAGPHKILNRISDRVFEMDVNGSSRRVSVENIKLAYFVREDIDNMSQLGLKSHVDENVITPLKTYSRKKNVSFNV